MLYIFILFFKKFLYRFEHNYIFTVLWFENNAKLSIETSLQNNNKNNSDLLTVPKCIFYKNLLFNYN